MNNRKAFTMVELILGAAILAAILGFAISFIRDTQRQAALSTAIGNLRQEAQMVLRAMERDIAGCLVIPDGYDADNIEKFKPDYDLGPSPRFKVAKENDNNNEKLFDIAEDSVLGEDISYSVDSGTGICKRGGQTIAHCVKSINTEEGDPNDSEMQGKVIITVEMESKVPGFNNKVASYTQKLVVTVRQIQNISGENKLKGRNKRWRQHIEN